MYGYVERVIHFLPKKFAKSRQQTITFTPKGPSMINKTLHRAVEKCEVVSLTHHYIVPVPECTLRHSVAVRLLIAIKIQFSDSV